MSDLLATAEAKLAKVRSTAAYALRQRETWANEGSELGRARAVAYQHVAGMLIDALSDPPTTVTTPPGPVNTGLVSSQEDK